MERIPDHYSQWEAHQAEIDRHLAKLPLCAECGEPIQSEWLYDLDGELVCESCMECHRQSVDNYIFE